MLGPVILDIKGLALEDDEVELLRHPSVGGVILFSRNYSDAEQLSELCQQIRSARNQFLFIMVDQEGGRVQRFCQAGFTQLPSMGWVGELYQHAPEKALQLAEQCGWVLASELLSVGIDFSLAPVLDLNKGLNAVIGNRAFGSQPNDVIVLAKQFISGLKKAGMVAIGKHFPGHGSVNLDSHLTLPIDTRTFAEIEQEDLRPFAALITAGLEGIMPAHILFSKVNELPVGFSSYWLQTILREKLQFQGVVFSDDLNMKGSELAGNYIERARTALKAGCDFILICNNRPGAIAILDQLEANYTVPMAKIACLKGRFTQSLNELQASHEWKNIQKNLESLTAH